MRRLELPGSVAETAAAAAAKGYPLEICGVLAGQSDGESASVLRLVPLPNVAEESQQRRRFVIDPAAIVKLDRELRKSGEQLLGFYHSHPDHEAAPSRTDLEYFRLWPETVWLIIPVQQGEAGKGRAWWLESPDDETASEIELVSSE